MFLFCQKLADDEIAAETLGSARFQNAAIIDEDFITREAVDKLKNGTFSTDINILAGFNANEGNYFLVYTTDGFTELKPDAISYSQYREGLNMALWGYPWSPFNETAQQINNENSKESVLQAIDFMYTDFERSVSDRMQSPDLPSENGYKEALDLIVGDLNFVCPTIEFMKNAFWQEEMQDYGSGTREVNTTKGSRYLYHFLHRSSQTPWPQWMGTLHGYEIEFAFGIPLNASLNYTRDEMELGRKMMRYWSNFAKTGYKLNQLC